MNRRVSKVAAESGSSSVSLVAMAGYFGALMCLLSLLPLPMLSFRIVAPWAICGAATLCAIALGRKNQIFGAVLFAIVGGFFNPLWPVTVEFAAHRIALVVAAVVFLTAAAKAPAIDALPPPASD